MTKKYETWAVLDTGKEVHYIESSYHDDCCQAPNTTYIKFQEEIK